jgi:two-component system, NarL family, nitrate/nitrite response regulator NarL
MPYDRERGAFTGAKHLTTESFGLAGMRDRRSLGHPGDMVLRCLLVDDSALFRQSAQTLLQREGLEVEVASTGAEATRRTGELCPDVVLLDIDLDGESGFDLARRLHAAQEPRDSCPDDLRIILISTHAERDFEELIGASPVLGFLPKSSLSARAIQELLHRATGQPS